MGKPIAPGLRIVLQSQPDTVRYGLRHVNEWIAQSGQPGLQGSVEIVLAEVINNVIEHAYAGEPQGIIEISLDPSEKGFACLIRDSGKPMPGEVLPKGSLPDLDVPLEDLPEGGFGWHMIRTLVDDLTYAREAGQNHLSFKMHAMDEATA